MNLSGRLVDYENNKLTKFQNLVENPVKTLVETQLNKQLPAKSVTVNVANEVSTQTSFIEPSANPSDSINETKLNSRSIETGDVSKRMSKEKIKEMLNIQKQQHEKRIMALEKLARLEKLQAEKLKALMMNSHNESLLCDSFFQSKNSIDREEDTINLQLAERLNLNDNFNKKANEIRKPLQPQLRNFYEDKTNRRNSNSNKIFMDTTNEIDMSYSSFNKSTSVEVLQLENTSVLKKPEGVLVINEITKRIDVNKNKKPISIEHNKENRLSMNRMNVQESLRRESRHKIAATPSSTSWFLPVTPIGAVGKTPAIPPRKDEAVLKRRISLLANESTEDKHLQNMSLQEAFETFRRDLISRSTQRQYEIQSRAQQRHQDAEFKRQHYEIMLGKKSELEVDSRRRRAHQLQNQHNYSSYFERKSGDSELGQQRRRMSVQEIKSQNRKMYEKLPEVQQKQERQRIEESRRLNRLKSSIFKKVLLLIFKFFFLVGLF